MHVWWSVLEDDWPSSVLRLPHSQKDDWLIDRQERLEENIVRIRRVGVGGEDGKLKYPSLELNVRANFNWREKDVSPDQVGVSFQMYGRTADGKVRWHDQTFEIDHLSKNKEKLFVEGTRTLGSGRVRSVVEELDLSINRDFIGAKVIIEEYGSKGGECIGERTVYLSDLGELVYLYQRKIFLFLPGLFGSRLSIDGEEVYPNLWGLVSDEAGKIGQFECDVKGEPLIRFSEAKLFEEALAVPDPLTGGNLIEVKEVYDLELPFETWRKRCSNTLYSYVRMNTHPLDIRPLPYDWRLNLEHSSKSIFRQIKKLNKWVSDRNDYDDKIVISGHSTGGLIARRICTFEEAGKYIDKAFFVNVPFRGAPKALAAFLLGADYNAQTKQYESLLPFLNQWSTASIAPTLPIVYFLAPSEAFSHAVTVYALEEDDREAEKEGLAILARRYGVDYRLRPVKSGLDSSTRQQLAHSADEWHEYKQRKEVPDSYTEIIENTLHPSKRSGKTSHDPEQGLDKSKLDFQRRYRKEPHKQSDWSKTIAAEAQKFHKKSEDKIGESEVDLYVFWSEGHDTTVRVRMDRDKLEAINENCSASFRSNVPTFKNPHDLVSIEPLHLAVEDWRSKLKECVIVDKEKDTVFYAEGEKGDGTVPIGSLKGIGSDEAKIFDPTPGGPAHDQGTNSPYVWNNILDEIMEEIEEKKEKMKEEQKAQMREDWADSREVGPPSY